MFHAFTSLLFESTIFVLLMTCLFWAVAGVVAADFTGRSRVHGALLGGLLPMVGWVLLLVPRRDHPQTIRRPAAVASPPIATPEPEGWEIPMAYASGGGPSYEPVYGVGTNVSASGRRTLAAPSVFVIAVGAAALLLMASAYVEPWINFGVTVTSNSYAGGDSLITAIPLGIGIVLLALAVGMQIRKPHGVWCLAGTLAGTVNLLVGTQIWLCTHAVNSLLSHASALIHSSENTSAGLGAASLAVSGLAAVTWALLSLRRPEPTS
jgi:hypothetical protein